MKLKLKQAKHSMKNAPETGAENMQDKKLNLTETKEATIKKKLKKGGGLKALMMKKKLV